MKCVVSASSKLEAEIVSTALKLKGCEHTVEFNDEQLELFDNKNCIQGIDIILEYIDERYPVCPLLPSDTIERAQVRMLYRTLTSKIHDPKQLNRLLVSEYTEYYRNTAFLFADKGITLIDVIIYAAKLPDKVWNKLRTGTEELFHNEVDFNTFDSSSGLRSINLGAVN